MAELKALQTAALEELRLQNEASEFVVVGSESGSEFSELEDDPGAVSTDGGSDGDVASFAGGDDDGTDDTSYTFVAPPPADTEDHKERLEKKIKEAEEKGRQMAAASARDAPKGKHKKPLPPGVQKITMFTQVKTEVKAEASQPNPGSQQ
ncbi:hypothetical protein DIPPA_19153 [Diplonema papillatum]|nr:hypothetical protein DIPPA_05925 [Diplonema papillatum]KAJ9453739.1 hypothetical protein DIPPA_19153 [Diplonema papillatum]